MTEMLSIDVRDDNGWNRRHVYQVDIPLGATDDADVITIERVDGVIVISCTEDNVRDVKHCYPLERVE